MSSNIKLDSEEKVIGKDLKLHLGCFRKAIWGFINVDVRPQPETNADIVDDVIYLNKFHSNSASLIYVCHCAEHFTREESFVAFKRWYDVLQPGGTLRISVPSLEKVFGHYALYKDLRYLQNMLYGSQKHFADFHKTGWDFRTLKEDLESVGFKDIKEYDHTKTEHAYVDDYSAAYFPHKDFVNGICMSLNICGTK